MSGWWYASNGEKTGPVELAEIERLYAGEMIASETLVWKHGMPDWIPLKDVDDLNHLGKASISPLPDPVQVVLPVEQQAGAWRRFFARIFDTWWETWAVALPLAFAIGAYSPSFARWFGMPGASQTFTLACFPIAMVLDAFVVSLFGNSPGKALLGIKVFDSFGSRLTNIENLSRNMRVWVGGFAFSIPLVNLITFFRQFRRVRAGKPASYDERDAISVRTYSRHWFKTSLFVLFFLMLFVAQDAFNQFKKSQKGDQRVKPTTAASTIWLNPVTGRTVALPKGWTLQASIA